ncbi:hypothetical protein [Listeria costaricensis]|uniref:hypothetical protein n=1 Tax=Listeria costaricensis TaxID=2026604 RepID=UPI000C07B0B1|nr:hypothetical protein [Listeria costaricensis]
MAFGVKRAELEAFKEKAARGEIALITHYWLDARFPDANTVTKAASSDLAKLKAWGKQYGLPEAYIDYNHEGLPHYDLFGEIQRMILIKEGEMEQLHRFHLEGDQDDKTRK